MGTFDENEVISNTLIGQEIRWSHGSLGVDEVAFDALYGRLEVFEVLGRIEIVDYGHESYTVRRLFSRVAFQPARAIGEPRRAAGISSSCIEPVQPIFPAIDPIWLHPLKWEEPGSQGSSARSCMAHSITHPLPTGRFC